MIWPTINRLKLCGKIAQVKLENQFLSLFHLFFSKSVGVLLIFFNLKFDRMDSSFILGISVILSLIISFTRSNNGFRICNSVLYFNPFH